MIAAALTCLALNVYYEAAREPMAGQVAVAAVTLNRAHDDPARVCAAVYARHTARDGRKVAAFSWTLGRAWRAPGPVSVRLYRRALFVAKGVLDGALKAPFGTDVMNYHATYCHPAWHARAVARIGHHIFYRG